MRFGRIFRGIGPFAKKHSTPILVGTGLIGMTAALVLVAKETVAAQEELEELKEQKKEELALETVEEVPVTKKEVVKTVWKCYIPSAIVFVSSVGCILASHKVRSGREAALLGIANTSLSTLAEYKNVVKETVGEEAWSKIEDKVETKRVEDAYKVVGSNLIPTPGEGEILFYDPFLNRFFATTQANVEIALAKLNSMIFRWDAASLSDFYNILGIDSGTLSDCIGWNTRERDEVRVLARSKVYDGERTCRVLMFNIDPQVNFDHF